MSFVSSDPGNEREVHLWLALLPCGSQGKPPTRLSDGVFLSESPHDSADTPRSGRSSLHDVGRDIVRIVGLIHLAHGMRFSPTSRLDLQPRSHRQHCVAYRRRGTVRGGSEVNSHPIQRIHEGHGSSLVDDIVGTPARLAVATNRQD